MKTILARFWGTQKPVIHDPRKGLDFEFDLAERGLYRACDAHMVAIVAFRTTATGNSRRVSSLVAAINSAYRFDHTLIRVGRTCQDLPHFANTPEHGTILRCDVEQHAYILGGASQVAFAQLYDQINQRARWLMIGKPTTFHSDDFQALPDQLCANFLSLPGKLECWTMLIDSDDDFVLATLPYQSQTESLLTSLIVSGEAEYASART